MYLGGVRELFVVMLACSLASVSCTRQVETATHRAARAAPPPAVTAAMSKHIENAIDAGEGDVELRDLRRRVAANAADLDARVLLARLYLRRGLPDLALEHYRLAAAQFPDSAVVALELAKTLRQVGQSQQALEAVNTFLKRNPARTWELLSLDGILQDDSGMLTEAEASHRAALALAPTRSGLHNNLGYNLLLQGRPDAAAQEFRQATEIDPRSQIAHNNLGTALALQTPASSSALAEWQRTSDPAVAHNNLGAVLIEQGRYADARVELTAALRLHRDFAPALANLKLVAQKDGLPITLDHGVQQSAHNAFTARLSRLLPGRAKSKTPAPTAAVEGGKSNY